MARLAVAGTCWGCRVQVPAFRHAGLEVAALWGRTPERAARAAAGSGVGFATADFAEKVAFDPGPELPPGLADSDFTRGTVALGRALVAALDRGDRSALTPGASFADGLAVQRVLDAARRSAREGRRVRIDPEPGETG